MYSIKNIFTGTDYKSSQFTPEEIAAVEEKIYLKNDKPFIKCLVREKEIQIKPEEIIRQLFLQRLVKTYGYEISQMKLEYPITFGSDINTKKADIVIFEKNRPTTAYIIVELKKPKLKEGKEQLKSYCNATGATMGVWTNGESISFYQRKDPNYFEDIPDIPHANQKLKDILKERWTIAELIAKDKLLTENKSLSNLIREMEDEVLANAGVDVFEEVFKLIYTKLYDEKMSANNKNRVLEFRNYGDTDSDLKEVIQQLFDKAKEKWAGVFATDDKIKLTSSHLAICVSSLQNVKLFNSNLEVIDEAFEYLMSKSQKGEKGQYFTPRYVIDMCVKMLNPQENETMIDTAAGSCGFPVHTIFHVWHKNFGDSELFTAEDKPIEFAEYVQKKVFAIDFDEKAVRVARTLNLIAGDGKTNVLWLNTLDYDRWKEYLDDEDWDEIYHDGWIKLKKLRAAKNDNGKFNFDIVMANPPFAGDIKESRIIAKYELGKNAKGKYQSKVGRDILFIERNLNFLKPGGRMAIVLPQGRFNNSSDKYIRDFIAERCRILAVVGLHGNVFKPHTGTKTSVLFVQKWDEKLCPRRDDYPIFFATMKKPSKDNSGEKIYLKADGENFLRDKHKHLIVDHDLFNHDGLTHDGIAEAFEEFAKKENLSFFDSSSFDEEKYNSLAEELEITEIFLSEIQNKNRIDAEFFQAHYVENEKTLLNMPHILIEDCFKVTDGEHGSVEYLDDGVKYLTAENIRKGFVELSNVKYVSRAVDKKNSRSRVADEDILISIKGTLGSIAIADKSLIPCNMNRDVAILKAKNKSTELNYYLAAFLMSKFGFIQSCRGGSGGVQQMITLERLRKFIVPTFSEEFYGKIKNLFISAKNLREQAQEKYLSAEKILSAELGLESFAPSEENISVKSFSESFGSSGRLDAEFYQKKYDDLKNFLANKKTARLDEVAKIFKSIEPGSDFYCDEGTPFIRVSDITKFEIAEPEIKLSLQVDEKIFPRKDTILFSKDGSVGIAYKVREDLNAVTSGALLHLTVKNKSVLPNYLTLILNSKIVQMQAERDTNGAIIQHWKVDDIKKIPVPILPLETQEKISELVEESFMLRSESKRLLDEAKNLVEREIEKI